MKKIDHIGIAVKDLHTSIPLFERLLQTKCYKTEKVDSENVETAFFQIGESKIELIAGITSPNAIEKYINNRGEGIHHIALEVEDIPHEIHSLQQEGFRFINSEPKQGADNKMVCFLHPKDTNSVLIELVTDKK